jgi:imidazolonepropionase-like amidohydrolase
MQSSPAEANGENAQPPSGPRESNGAGQWIEHSVWPQDPMFGRALAAGVTTLQILPSSDRLFGGRSVVLKNVASISVQGMKFPGAPYGLKMACGENAERGSGRAGNMQGYRSAFIAATDYAHRWDEYRRKSASGQPGEPPGRDLTLETLAGVLRGEVRVQMHCYRADEMLQMIDLSKEFGFHITAFHHALEAFKIAPVLAREKVAVVTWAGDWSGYKMEAYDSIMENAAFVDRAGGIASMHSDDPQVMQHLNQEAARVMTAAQHDGLNVTPERAIQWITINPAAIIGVDKQTGSLEVGKMADLVVWNVNPFSVYSIPDLVFIDGALVHDRAHPPAQPRSDFELGQGTSGALP